MAEIINSLNKPLLQFPCDFPIKVIGKWHPKFERVIVGVIQNSGFEFDNIKVQSKNSSNGNYISVTVTVRAISRAQLDALYYVLTSHPMVRIVL
ncbi:YbeD family protein [Candidatus Vallotia lariciata]|uniref:HP0495 family protein n=1 Tax=Candidatus Vallotia laricis TaxID=2018052 RepID=UPI001D007C79|nr:DUF493 domain-containing protein [Candidatus Vallotia lariciata]UDG83334.1 hypothetical protein GKR41_00735 [Candidatus Vallotia lariciata]